MRYLNKVVFFVTIALLLIPSFSSAEQAIKSAPEDIKFVYVLSVESGRYDGNEITMTFSPKVIYFADRPNRIAGYMKFKEFLNVWDSNETNFNTDPPNALLSIYDHEGAVNSVIELDLIASRYSTAKFSTKILQGKVPKSFKEGTLFVDEAEGKSAVKLYME